MNLRETAQIQGANMGGSKYSNCFSTSASQARSNSGSIFRKLMSNVFNASSPVHSPSPPLPLSLSVSLPSKKVRNRECRQENKTKSKARVLEVSAHVTAAESGVCTV